MIIEVVGLLAGLILLAWGGSLIVDNSSRLSEIWGYPSLLLGMTFVALATSLPELAISITSLFQGFAQIGPATVIGSNIVNLGLVLGVAAFMSPLVVSKTHLKKEILFVLLGGALLFLLPHNALFGGFGFSLEWYDGAILLIAFVLFLWYASRHAGLDKEIKKLAKKQAKETTNNLFIFLLIGIALIVLGSWIVVRLGSNLAIHWGLEPEIVGLSIFALGVSMPELFTAIIARMRKKKELAIGMIIGSCVFNLLWVIGFTSLFGSIPFSMYLFFQLGVMMLFSLFLYIFMFSQRRLSSFEGFLMIGAYAVYLVALL